LLLAVTGLFGFLRNWRAVLLLFLVCWGYFGYVIVSHGDGSMVAIVTWPRLMTFFLAGMVAYVLRRKIFLNAVLAGFAFLILALATVASLFWLKVPGGGFYIAAPVCLTYLFFWLAYALPLAHINSKYDFSYGIYIYGTLILQVLSSKFTFVSHAAYFFMALALTILIAVLSWYLVESPCLQLKNLFRRSPLVAA
jgi:peptidoglycan/LPS O-acetylase OafA/YrhL